MSHLSYPLTEDAVRSERQIHGLLKIAMPSKMLFLEYIFGMMTRVTFMTDLVIK